MEQAVSLVRRHIASYPESELPDVYKLLYQACMGPEHAVSDPATTKHWLDREWEDIEAADGDVYEDIAVHSPLYRIHLRPVKLSKIEPDWILNAFIETAEKFPKRPDLLREAWHSIVTEIEEGRLEVGGSDELAEFYKLIRENDFPAVRHSENYREAYKPAYRLVHCRL